jgi:hypothetical protein
MRRAYVLFLAEGLSGSGVAFFLDTFTWRSKKKYLASLAYDFASALALSKSEYPCGAKAT